MVAELRLKHLFNDVDEFIVVESRVTHSGKQKDTLYVDRDWKSFKPYLSKVRTYAIPQSPGGYLHAAPAMAQLVAAPVSLGILNRQPCPVHGRVI